MIHEGRARTPLHSGSQAVAAPCEFASRDYDPVHRIFFVLLVIQVFLLYSRAPEFLSSTFGIGSVVRVLSIATLAGTLFCGGVGFAILSRSGVCLSLLTCWFLLSTPFSVWKGGSVNLLVDQWLKSYLLFIMIAGLIRTLPQLRRVLVSIGLATIVIAVSALMQGYEKAGRLQLGSSGTFANPNALAFVLITGLPFCLLLSMDENRRSKLLVLAGGVGTAFLIVVTLKTGSRMGLVMIAALSGVFLLRATRRQRLVFVTAALALTFISIAAAPEASLVRYKLLFSDAVEDETANVDDVVLNQADRAQGSSQARLELLKESIRMTVRHPLFGVGPGMFSVATANDESPVGGKETHNGYTQVSSEAGIPALALYVAALALCLRSTFVWQLRLRCAGENSLANMSFAIFLALVAFAIGNLFASSAYSPTFPALAGLVVAFERCMQRPLPNSNLRPAAGMLKARSAAAV